MPEDTDDLHDFDKQAEQMPEIPETVWRWEKNGSGNYKGRYYTWRKRGDPKRPTLKGASGSFDNPKQTLPTRTGKGNRTRGAERQSKRLPASDATIDQSYEGIRGSQVGGEIGLV